MAATEGRCVGGGIRANSGGARLAPVHLGKLAMLGQQEA